MEGALLLFVTLSLTASAFFVMRHEVRRLAGERLATVASQFADLFAVSTIQGYARIRGSAAQEALRAFIVTPNAKTRAAAIAALAYKGPQPEQVVAVGLRDSAGSSLAMAGAGQDFIRTAIASHRLSVAPLPDSVAVGPFMRGGADTIIYTITARSASRPAYYVVEWRRIVGSPRTRETLNGLIGTNATLLFGNADGSLWLDLNGSVVPRTVSARDIGHALSYAAPGPESNRIAEVRAIPGTTWLVLLEFPEGAIMAPAHRLAGGLAIGAIVCLLLGLGAAWISGRRITAPIRHLTEAAERIGAGDVSARVPVNRGDEIGRLSVMFNAMADDVAEAHARLEERVAERTRELESARDSLVRKEKLAILGQLAGGVGHELRNPLGVMSNIVYYLDKVLDDTPPKVKEYIGMMRQQIVLSEKIISDVLDFARIREPIREPVDLRDIVNHQLERLGKHDEVRIVQEIPDPLPVRVDQVQIGLVVFNLLTNAVQAMGEGGGVVTIKGNPNGSGRLNLDIADTGPGVPHELRERIFEPLFTTKPRGIGLGLAVSQALAEANDGELKVGGAPGFGAVFTLSLPLNKS